jgi:hypothetical protein
LPGVMEVGGCRFTWRGRVKGGIAAAQVISDAAVGFHHTWVEGEDFARYQRIVMQFAILVSAMLYGGDATTWHVAMRASAVSTGVDSQLFTIMIGFAIMAR